MQISTSMEKKLLTNFVNKKDSILKEEFHTTKDIEIYSQTLQRKLSILIMINILKEIVE